MRRTSLFVAGALVAAAAIVHSGVFGPGPNTETIPSTGQDLTLTITAPANNDLVPIPPGTVSLTAEVSVGNEVNQSGNVVYVLDVSGSTDLNFQVANGVPYVDADGDGVGSYGTPDAGDNFNGPSGDTEAGEVLDGEIAGVLALHSSIGTPSFPVRVGLIAFGTSAETADVDPAAGVQVFTTPPQVDLNGLNGADIPEVARTFRSESPGNGTIGAFTAFSMGSNTNFVAALAEINDALAAFPPATFNQVFFLSDGMPTTGGTCTGGSCDAELAEAVAAGTVIHTVAVGAGASAAELQVISNATNGMFVQVTDPSDLSAVLPSIPPAGIAGCTLQVGGGMPVPISVSPLGTISETVTCPGEGTFTATIECTADDPDSTTVSADVDFQCVNVACGDGEPDPGEECEPPNTPTCDANCQRVPVCGDGFVDAPEMCDDGNTQAGDCCSPTCQAEPDGSPCPGDGNPCRTFTCDGVQGLCVGADRPDGTICDDADVCTINDTCQAGQCTGGSGSDQDGDGDCDLKEIACGCSVSDDKEVCLLPNRLVGRAGNGVGEVLMNWYAPTTKRPEVFTDPSCATAGECTAGRCTRGKVYDTCTTNADCDQPPFTCRVIVNWAEIGDLALNWARVGRTNVAGFTPVTPGCSRKADVPLDPDRASNALRLKALGTVDGRFARDRDTFRYRRK